MHGIYIGQLINVPSTMVAGDKDDIVCFPNIPHKTFQTTQEAIIRSSFACSR